MLAIHHHAARLEPSIGYSKNLPLTYSNLFVQPISRSLILYWDKWAIGTALKCNAHAGSLLGDGLDVHQSNVPLRLELLGSHKHYSTIRQHDHQVFARKFQVRDVVFVKVGPIISGLQPELAQRFTLGVRAHDSLESNEAGKADTVQTVRIEDGRSVANTLS